MRTFLPGSNAALLLLVAILMGCSAESRTPLNPIAAPVEPAPTPAPAPTPTPTPVPTPDPNPSVWPNGQARVVRLTIRVHWIEDKDHKVKPYKEGDPINAGDLIRFDATAKDSDNRPTEGSGDEPRWSWEPDEVAMLNDTHGFNPRGKAISPGKFYVTAYLDSVDSNVLVLTIQ